MESRRKELLIKSIETIVPSIVKAYTKKIFWKFARFYYKIKYLKKGKFVEFGYRFRYSRKAPYLTEIGDRTIVEDFNVWNAKGGNISVGKKCWFGLHNIIMGPVEIGDSSSTGSFVCIIGPRHPVLNSTDLSREKTIIGKNVWVGTGSIIMFGVKIGDDAIISAGSVVGKDVPQKAFFAGNPARDITKFASMSWRRES